LSGASLIGMARPSAVRMLAVSLMVISKNQGLGARAILCPVMADRQGQGGRRGRLCCGELMPAICRLLC
jgi:hypothetical protein